MTEAKAVTATFTADASGNGTVEGIVQNFFSDTGEGGTRNVIANASLTFRDTSGTVVGNTTTNANGVYSLALPTGTLEATITATGFLSTTLTVQVVANRVTVADPVLLVQDVPAGTGGISGQVRDVLAGNGCIGCPLGGATVDLRRGVHAASGPIVATTTTSTDGFGAYAFSNLPAGSYTTTASKAGYFSASFTTGVVGPFTTPENIGIMLSPVLSPNEIRIVLNWSTSPSDLDAHLTGPLLSSASRFHVFNDPTGVGSLTASPFAALQAAVFGGFGPETMTISQRVAGMYRFSVHSFSDRASTTSSRLSKSQAQVHIYVGANPTPAIFNVPPARPGTLWTVFEMDGTTGVITPVNSLTFAQDPAAIQ